MTTQQELLRQVEAALNYAHRELTKDEVMGRGKNAGMYEGSTVESRIKQALPAINELLRMSAWQPIESAPNMGVFVVRNSDGTCWMHDEEDGHTDWLETYFLGYQPTHWMPLLPQPDKGKL